MMRSIALLLAALGLWLAVAPDAEAQRRRRRRRRPPPPVQEPVEAEPSPGADGQGEASADAAEASPGAQVDGAQVDGAQVDGAPLPEGDAAPDASEAPSTAPAAAFDPGPAPPDVSPIRADYVTLMDELVQARMRVHALGSELFRTRITVDLQDRTGDSVGLSRVTVRLDGAPIYQHEGPVEGGDDGARIFEGALAPGPHVLRLEVEQRQREDDSYRYTLEESFRFQVVRERANEVTLILEDDSDMASSFASGGEGRYEVRTRMRVAARALED